MPFDVRWPFARPVPRKPFSLQSPVSFLVHSFLPPNPNITLVDTCGQINTNANKIYLKKCNFLFIIQISDISNNKNNLKKYIFIWGFNKFETNWRHNKYPLLLWLLNQENVIALIWFNIITHYFFVIFSGNHNI